MGLRCLPFFQRRVDLVRARNRFEWTGDHAVLHDSYQHGWNLALAPWVDFERGGFVTRPVSVPVSDFETLVNKAMADAVSAFNAAGELRPSVEIVRFEVKGGEIVTQTIPLDGAHRYFGYDGGKDDLAQLLQSLYVAAGDAHTVGALVVHEAWLRVAKMDQPVLDLTVPPSMAPDRQEALVCSLNMSNGDNYTHFLIVDPVSRKVAFEPFSVVDGVATGTRFSAAPSSSQNEGDDPPAAPVFH